MSLCPNPPLSLQYGQTLLAFEAELDAEHQATQVQCLDLGFSAIKK